MKLTLFALVAVCLVAVCHSVADGEFDYEEEAPAAPAPTKASPKSRLGSLLAPKARGPAASISPRKASGAAPVAAKTTTTTEAPAELTEEDYEEGAEEEGKQDAITTTSTTEAPKKIGRGTAVRPFRSNEDLLAALKRRRAQGLSSITKEPASTHVPTEAAPSKAKAQPSSRAKSNEVSKSTSRQRFGGGRSKSAAPAQEEVEETKTEDVKAKPYRRG